jgi:hypothetical protein
VLNPNFAVNDVEVDEGAIDTLVVLPSCLEQQVMVIFPIENQFLLDALFLTHEFGILSQDFFKDGAILIG